MESQRRKSKAKEELTQAAEATAVKDDGFEFIVPIAPLARGCHFW
jgi:hypothetical protein